MTTPVTYNKIESATLFSVSVHFICKCFGDASSKIIKYLSNTDCLCHSQSSVIYYIPFLHFCNNFLVFFKLKSNM